MELNAGAKDVGFTVIRTRGTGYKYFDTKVSSRMSEESFLYALRNAQRANNRYKFKSIFVQTAVSHYTEEFQAYWRVASVILSSRESAQVKFDEYLACDPEKLDEGRRDEAYCVQTMIQGLSDVFGSNVVITEQKLNCLRSVSDRVKRRTNQVTLVRKLAKFAAERLVKKESAGTLKSKCELKAKGLGIADSIAEGLIDVTLHIRKSLQQ